VAATFGVCEVSYECATVQLCSINSMYPLTRMFSLEVKHITTSWGCAKSEGSSLPGLLELGRKGPYYDGVRYMDLH
jgi:hypothetical protein